MGLSVVRGEEDEVDEEDEGVVEEEGAEAAGGQMGDEGEVSIFRAFVYVCISQRVHQRVCLQIE